MNSIRWAFAIINSISEETPSYLEVPHKSRSKDWPARPLFETPACTEKGKTKLPFTKGITDVISFDVE